MSKPNYVGGFLLRFVKSIGSITLWAFLKTIFKAAVILGIVAFVAVFALVHYPSTTVPEVEPISQTRYLGQGWTDEPASSFRQLYYYTPQGSSIPPGSTESALRYEWLVHLERAWGKERFAEPEHMRSLGFIVDETPSPANPDLLPVGLTKHWDETLGEDLLDITCATCHTGQLNIDNDGQRTAIRIDGGAGTHAILDLSLQQFAPSLLGAMASTYLNPFKFNRFAKKVLKENYRHGKAKLRKNFGRTIIALATQKQNNPLLKLYPVEEGYGRIDAIGRIANTVFGRHLDTKNFSKGDAPVSYPPLWNAWKFDWVQYSGSVKQPMARNMGEVLGVGARINLSDPYGRPLPAEERFSSSIRVEDLHRLEITLQQLKQPQWDEQLLGAIDRERAAAGQKLFSEHCQSCHGPHITPQKVKHAESPLKGANDPEWTVKLLDVEEIGTDSTAADNFVDNRYDMTQTGITKEEVSDLLRPLFIRQLKNHVDAEFDSPFINSFLAGDEPKSIELERDTSWMKNQSWKLEQFVTLFDKWTKSGPGALEKALVDDVVDPDKIELVRIEIVRIALQKIEQELSKVDLSKVSVGQGLNYLATLLRQKYYADNDVSEAKQECLNGFGTMDLPQVLRVYKARPLGGMWSTPPFLHNGSVLSVYELLSPPEDRAKEFYLGQNTFDPEKLGLISDTKEEGGILFDTKIKGNYNAGHEFKEGYIPYKEGVKPKKGIIGPPLSHDERMAIIEYLKIHQDPATPKNRVIQTCTNL
jgi:hypothetical protein